MADRQSEQRNSAMHEMARYKRLTFPEEILQENDDSLPNLSAA
jgi:hypothetical protein